VDAQTLGGDDANVKQRLSVALFQPAIIH